MASCNNPTEISKLSDAVLTHSVQNTDKTISSDYFLVNNNNQSISRFPTLDTLIALIPLCRCFRWCCCKQYNIIICFGTILALFNFGYGIYILYEDLYQLHTSSIASILIDAVWIIQPIINSIPILQFYNSKHYSSSIWIYSQNKHSYLFKVDQKQQKKLNNIIQIAILYVCVISFSIFILQFFMIIVVWLYFKKRDFALVMKTFAYIVEALVIQYPNCPMSITMHLYFKEISYQIQIFKNKLQRIDIDHIDNDIKYITSIVNEYACIVNKLNKIMNRAKYWLSGTFLLCLCLIWWNVQLWISYKSFQHYLNSFGWKSDTHSISQYMYFIAYTCFINICLFTALFLSVFALIPLLEISSMYKEIKIIVVQKCYKLLKEIEHDTDSKSHKKFVWRWLIQLSMEIEAKPAMATMFGFAVDYQNMRRILIPFVIARSFTVLWKLTPLGNI